MRGVDSVYTFYVDVTDPIGDHDADLTPACIDRVDPSPGGRLVKGLELLLVPARTTIKFGGDWIADFIDED